MPDQRIPPTSAIVGQTTPDGGQAPAPVEQATAPDSIEQTTPAEGQFSTPDGGPAPAPAEQAAPEPAQLPHAPHDAFFSAVFSIPEIAAAYLRERLPADIVELLAAEPPEKLDSKFMGESFQRSRSDLILRAPLASGGSAYPLLEHKSRSDGGVFDQLARYQRGVWSHCAEKDGGQAAVIPMVVYHGREAWDFPAALAELNEQLPLALQPHAQRLNCLFHDLSEGSPLELARDRDLRACLATLRGAYRSEEFSDAEIREIFRDLRSGRLKDFVASYVTSVWAAPDERVEAVLQTLFPKQPEVIVDTFAQRRRAEGKAEVIANLLRHQFGPLPLAAATRLAQGSAAELDTWAIRALDAPSVEAVFKGGS